MQRLAIFVEGQTERVFVRKLLVEIAGAKRIDFQEERYLSKQFQLLSGFDNAGHVEYQALIVDCCGDGTVKSAILERRPGLVNAGYGLIIGLRDLYPLPRGELQDLKKGLAYKLPTAGVPTHVIVAVMEVEAWFAQDLHHFANIHPSLTPPFLASAFPVDLRTTSAEELEHPSEYLQGVYRLIGKGYRKSRSQVARTVNAIDYANLFFNLRGLLPSFDEFAQLIDDFIV